MAKKDNGVTPMMQQFLNLKAKHPDALLLFRCGDFYETYSDDAVVASQILGITLTRRSNGGQADTPMAGFPYHALDTYLPKLIRAGKRVAICEILVCCVISRYCIMAPAATTPLLMCSTPKPLSDFVPKCLSSFCLALCSVNTQSSISNTHILLPK